jgi:hypothetical protein
MLIKIERLELINNMPSMSEAFNERGYFTVFVQSSARNLLCGYDYDLLDFTAEKAASSLMQGCPFLYFSFTSSTAHGDFGPTTKEFEKISFNQRLQQAY